MSLNRLLTTLACVVFLGTAGAMAAYAYKNPADGRIMGNADVPYQATFSGTTGCLPHRGDGPHTMECALGLETDLGFFIALDLSAVQFEAGVGLDTGESVTVHGLYVPVEQMSGTMGQMYDIHGVMRVDSVERS